MKRKMSMSNEESMEPGVGLDVGTMNIVSARQAEDRTQTRRVRDAFIDLDVEAKRSLRMSKVSYIEKGGQLIVIGDSALDMANLFNREVRRPLAKGLISPGELDAQEVLSLMIFQVLGEPLRHGEHCYYSVPAEPVDVPDQDVAYHREVFKSIIAEHGYTPHPMNEALAIIYSQCAQEQFSGLAISYGSGMCNVALSYQTMMGLDFSISRGGDWIDLHAAKALGSTAARMCSIKEKGGFNLASPPRGNREAEALSLYIRSLISYSLEKIAVQFRKDSGKVNLPTPIPFVVSGGTTKAEGFMSLFEEEFASIRKRGFPIEISEIRRAKDPMTAVAEGLLVLALQEEEETRGA